MFSKNNIKQYEGFVKCLEDIISENLNDIGDDQVSDYALMRMGQNMTLAQIKYYFSDLIDAHQYTE